MNIQHTVSFPPATSPQNWIVADIMGSGRNPLHVFCRAGPASMPDAEGLMRTTWVIRALSKGATRGGWGGFGVVGYNRIA